MPEAASARRFGCDPGRRIEADGILRLAGVEVAHLVDARVWDRVEDVLGEVAVRIDDGDAFARINVAHGEVEEKRALARAGFADDPNVALTLLTREDDRTAVCGGRYCEMLWLHNVAPASGDKRGLPLEPHLPSCALPYLWRSGLARHAERPVVRCSRRTTRDRRHVVRRGLFSLPSTRNEAGSIVWGWNVDMPASGFIRTSRLIPLEGREVRHSSGADAFMRARRQRRSRSAGRPPRSGLP